MLHPLLPVLFLLVPLLAGSAANSRAEATTQPILAVIEVKVKDGKAFGEYVSGHMPSLQKHGGRILAAGPAPETIEGQREFDVLVVQEWPSREAFQNWHNSPEYLPWRQLREMKAAEWTRVFLVSSTTPKQ